MENSHSGRDAPFMARTPRRADGVSFCRGRLSGPARSTSAPLESSYRLPIMSNTTADAPARRSRSPRPDTDRSQSPTPNDNCSPGHTSVFLVDDHPPIRRAISEAVNGKIDLEIVGEAGRLDGTLDQIAEAAPDVVVIDISLPDGHGLDLVQSLAETHPEIQTIVFSMYDEAVYAERALRAGASGYLMKTESLQDLVEALRSVERGEMYLSRTMATQILSGRRGGATPSFAIDELTEREFQVFRLLGRGHTVQEIEERLDLSRKTVETYRRRAKEKLGFDSVSELLQHAVQWTYVQRASHIDEPVAVDAMPLDEE